jgi:hypothetical protein
MDGAVYAVGGRTGWRMAEVRAVSGNGQGLLSVLMTGQAPGVRRGELPERTRALGRKHSGKSARPAKRRRAGA